MSVCVCVIIVGILIMFHLFLPAVLLYGRIIHRFQSGLYMKQDLGCCWIDFFLTMVVINVQIYL